MQGRAPTSAAAALASRPGDAGGEETDDDDGPRAYPEAGALSASGQKVPFGFRVSGPMYLEASVSERRGNNLKGFQGFNLKAKARIWP